MRHGTGHLARGLLDAIGSENPTVEAKAAAFRVAAVLQLLEGALSNG